MGISHSPAELSRKLSKLAVEYQNQDAVVVREAAQLTKQAVLARAPKRLSGVGKKGARLNARYVLSLSGDTPSALVFAQGPWQFIENDTRPHRIPRQTARKRGKRRYAVVPGVGPRAYALHPGTRGQHPWRNGVLAAEPAIARMFDNKTSVVMGRIF